MPKRKKHPKKNTGILSYSSSKKTTDNCKEPEDASAQTDASEILKCEKCGKTVDNLLQCECCSLWNCCQCQNVPDIMFAALNNYDSLHWYCQTRESAVVDAVSRLNTEVS